MMTQTISLLLIVFLSLKLSAQSIDTIPFKTQNDALLKANDATANYLDKNKFYTNKDSIIIITDNYTERLVYSKKDFNMIVDNFPELYRRKMNTPDSAYNKKYSAFIPLSSNKAIQISFNSEVGEDTYFILYKYFLMKRNGINQCSEERRKLNSIYREINNIYAILNYGGTYFGHQHKRIEGIAEYSIYLNKINKNNFVDMSRFYPQKKHYIVSLNNSVKQFIAKDNDTMLFDKTKQLQKAYVHIKKLNSLITNSFYLKMAKQFQYKYYIL